MISKSVNIFWFRRDLRLHDNNGLERAFCEPEEVLPIFIFDENILRRLTDRDDARVSFIHSCIESIEQHLSVNNKHIQVYYGKPIEVFRHLLSAYKVNKIFANQDYEPYARARDREIQDMLRAKGIDFIACKDHVIFAPHEVLKENSTPYTVFTPYSKKWKALLKSNHLQKFNSEARITSFASVSQQMLSLPDINFVRSKISVPPAKIPHEIVDKYAERRNYPCEQSTTHLGVHLRFGTVSIRECVAVAKERSEEWLNELIWREFFMQLLFHFPHTVTESFKTNYKMPWRDAPDELQAWTEGLTGYPIVDAGMRELVATGFMHNRVRMIVGSFLCKHLLVDWRCGERFFARYLLDFELSANVGNWQWVAGSGADAAPFFRIFNPYMQAQKFDPEQKYQKKWIPELNTPDYPHPIVEHARARQRALHAYSTSR